MRKTRTEAFPCRPPSRSWRRWVLLWTALVVLGAVMTRARAAAAHGGDTTYVVLTPNGTAIEGTLNLDLFDTEGILRLPRAELVAGQHADVVSSYLVTHLSLTDGTWPCPLEPAPQSMTVDAKTARLFLKFVARCRRVPTRIDVAFDIFFQAAGYYLGIVRIDGATQETQLFTNERRSGTFVLEEPDAASGSSVSGPARDGATASPPAGPTSPEGRPRAGPSRWWWHGLSSAIDIGIVHIWSGADHMLFLLALLMTSVVERSGGAWVPRASLRASLVDVAKIVTGFTLTRWVTLSLAALGLLRPAARVIEPAIAASVAVAAFDNLRPFLRGRK